MDPFPHLHNPAFRAVAEAVDGPLGAAVSTSAKTHNPKPLRFIASELRKAHVGRAKARAAAEVMAKAKADGTDQELDAKRAAAARLAFDPDALVHVVCRKKM